MKAVMLVIVDEEDIESFESGSYKTHVFIDDLNADEAKVIFEKLKNKLIDHYLWLDIRKRNVRMKPHDHLLEIRRNKSER